jgi:NADH-quinone oxidoreductase subunit G
VKELIVIDHSLSRTALAADLVLPAAPFAEGDGTLVSSEGRVQRFFQVYAAPTDVRESWRWLAELAEARGGSAQWRTLDEIVDAVARHVPALAAIRDAAPSARFRIVGQRIGREPPRYSGRTAVHADVEIREGPPPHDVDAPLAFSMEGYHGQRTPPALRPFYWAPGWNSQQSVNKFQAEIGGRLRGGDPGVRLFERVEAAERGYVEPAPAAPLPAGELYVVPIHDVFKDEEQSAASPPILERATPSEIRLHVDDAAALRVRDGDRVTVERGGAVLTAPVRVSSATARGTVGVPACSALWLHEAAAGARARAAAAEAP